MQHGRLQEKGERTVRVAVHTEEEETAPRMEHSTTTVLQMPATDHITDMVLRAARQQDLPIQNPAIKMATPAVCTEGQVQSLPMQTVREEAITARVPEEVRLHTVHHLRAAAVATITGTAPLTATLQISEATQVQVWEAVQLPAHLAEDAAVAPLTEDRGKRIRIPQEAFLKEYI